jgi:hypothetical protein
MKTRTIYLLVFSLLLLAAASLMGSCTEMYGIKGDGNVVKEDRDVSGFASIEVSGAFNVLLYQGDTESLTVEADENLVPLIITRVRGNRLEIYTEEKIREATEMNIFLTFKQLEMIDLSGAVSLKGEEILEFDELDIDGSGATEVWLKMNAQELETDFSGASDVHLVGSANKARFDVSGASEIRAYDFVIAHCEIEVSGAAEADIHVTGNLDVEVSGAATLRYKGSPQVRSDISGAGSLKAR